jgi:DNA adenine methylase
MPETTQISSPAIAVKPLAKPQPFIKWAGGKRLVVEKYRPYLPSAYAAYHEPFLGGGAVFFDLEPELAILSDVNPEIVNAYIQIRDNLDEVIKGLTLAAEMNCKEFYYEVRDRYPADANDFKQAIRFLYLNKTAFNGLYRKSKKSGFNVPYGSYKKPRICDAENLVACHEALQGVTLTCQEFKAAADSVQAGDFVYFDPPYHGTFTGYTEFGFTESDQEELAGVFKTCVEKGAYALLSNSDTDLVRSLYKDFEIVSIQEHRHISAKNKGRGRKPCVLVIGGERA